MIQIRISCVNVEVPKEHLAEIEESFEREFYRLTHFVREAQVTLRDLNGPRGGIDKLCILEVKLHPRGVAVVKSKGSSFPQAMNFACDKMKQVVMKRLGKKKSTSSRRLLVTFEPQTA